MRSVPNAAYFELTKASISFGVNVLLEKKIKIKKRITFYTEKQNNIILV